MFGFETLTPDQDGIPHPEFYDKALAETIDFVCDTNTEKKIEVIGMLATKHGLICAVLMDWPSAKNFREYKRYDIEALKDAKTETVYENNYSILIYVKMKDVDCHWVD